jgi:tRNA-uridine 2-sulfurtransferase
LLKASDKNKDQSYFLFTLKQDQLASTLFPLGGMTKPEVRALAAKFGLRVAEKKESQEICFVPDNDYAQFIEKSCATVRRPGAIVGSEGKILGQHDGTHRYTIGQRKGLGLSHLGPLFVIGINADKNEVIVGGEPELYQDRFLAKEINWIVPNPILPINAACKIRYRHEPVACRILPLMDGRVEVRLDKPERAITPGQAVVFYLGEEVLGGGWIENKEP